MAAALDIIGDRWALLVVRELILGARTFTQIASGLPGIGTDILTSRLRSLEQSEVLRRVGEGRRQRYELTSSGLELRPVLAELGRWGAGRLGLPKNPDQVCARVGLTALVLDPPLLAKDLSGSYEMQVGDDVARLKVRSGRLSLVTSHDSHPTDDWSPTVIELSQPGLIGLLIGTRARHLARSGGLAIRGDRQGAIRMLDALSAPRVLTTLTKD